MSLRPYRLVGNERILHIIPEVQLNTQKEDISKFFTDGRYQRVEKEILRALYQYPYLTKRSLSRYLDSQLKEYKRDNYNNMIHTMWLDGVIERYHYGDTKLYHLSQNARSYMEIGLKDKKKRDYIHPLVTDSAAVILECASLAQWQISLMCGNEEIIQTRFYENIKVDKRILPVKSYVELKKNKYHYIIHSFCIPKDRAHVEDFIKDLILYINIFAGKRMKGDCVRLFVFVAEDMEQIEQTGSILSVRNELKGVKYHFVLDSDTNYTNGLDLLHFFSMENKEKIIDTLELTGN